MKKIIFAGLFLFSLTMVQAQDAKKACGSKTSSCCSSKTAAKASASVETGTAVLSAMEAANKDENIEVTTDKETGKVSYFMKSTDSESGEASLSEVSYDAEKGVFVSKSAGEVMANGKACCSSKVAKGDAKGCCSSGKAIKSANTNKAIGTGISPTNGKAKRPAIKTSHK